MNDAVFAALSRGATVVTANQRLSRSIVQTYGMRMRLQGCTAWKSPRVLPWEGFVQSNWKEAAGTRPLLTAAQEISLWEAAVDASAEQVDLLQPQGAARLAREAWRLAHAWRLPMEGNRNAHFWQASQETAAFHGWAQQVQWRVQWLDRQDPALLTDAVRSALQGGALPTPATELLLAGFDELAPQQRQLVAALEARNVSVSRMGAPRGTGGRPKLAALPDAEGEIDAAAAWAAQRLAANPAASVAVVVPKLEELRAEAARAFTRHARGAFHISLGPTLNTRPSIATAIALLEFCRPQVEWRTLSRILLSPYVRFFGEEREARARLDVELRNWRAFELAPVVAARHSACPPELGSMLRIWESIRRELPGEQAPSQWSATFTRLLEVFGWPATESVEEFQAVAAWREVLSQLASTDVTAGPIGVGRAASFVRRLAAERRFEADGNGEPIQILGILEAAGSTFDHLWVCGLDEDSWPARESPNPFLPLALQRKHGLPHSSAARELEYARRVTTRLIASAPEVVISYSSTSLERTLGPSPLIGNADEFVVSPQAVTGMAASKALPASDQPPPPAAEGFGGARALQFQALCPFRAFAELRLGARRWEEPELGLDPRERGKFLHAALEALWKKLGSSAALGGDTATAVAEAVHSAIPAPGGHDSFRDALLQMERDRLQAVLAAWLNFEKTRGAAFTVEQPEQEHEVHVGGLRVRIRLDRLDRLDSGEHVLVDYKTTAPPLSGWDGERPEDPQVPLYATTTEAPLTAVAFAQLKTGDFRFRGFATDADALPGARAVTPQELRERIVEWRRVLAQLGSDFARGAAAVDPKRGADTCKRCHLGPLCRIAEKRA